MKKKVSYGASLTGEPFLFFEIRQVARLKLDGLGDQEIKAKVQSENLFQYATEKSVARRLRAVLKRVAVLEEVLLKYLVNKPIESGRIINLYAIMETNPLFYNFMTEVIAEKFASNNLLLEKKDLNGFFQAQREQNEEVAKWTDATINKLKQVIIRILMEAGLLDKDKSSMQRPVIEPDLVKHFEEIGVKELLRAMGQASQ